MDMIDKYICTHYLRLILQNVGHLSVDKLLVKLTSSEFGYL